MKSNNYNNKDKLTNIHIRTFNTLFSYFLASITLLEKDMFAKRKTNLTLFSL